MKYKRGFLSGVISINDVLHIESVYVRQIDVRHTRAYQIKALPNNEIIFWSDSRKKTNDFIKKEILKRNLKYRLENSIKYKSLDYNYKCTPGSYIIMSLAFMCFAILFVNQSNSSDWIYYFFLLGSIYGLIMTVISSRNIKTPTRR